jgi:tetratricopeptide (TPR) repeat protein
MKQAPEQTRKAMKRRNLRLRLSLILLLAPGGASAEPDSISTPEVASPARRVASAAEKAEADALFRRGVAHYRAGERKAAVAAFARAHELSSDYRLLFNMAQIQQDLEDHAEALRLLALYLDQAGPRLDARRRAQVELDMARLEKRVASVQVTSNVDGARLWIDDAPAGTVPSPRRWLNPGQRRFRVEKSGRSPVLRTVAVHAGERLALEIPMAAPEPTPPSGSEATGHATVDRTPFWLSIGALGTSAGLAIGFGVLARIGDARLDRELDRFPADEEAIDAARSRVETFATATDVCLGVAALAAGASLYFAFRPDPEDGVPARGVIGLGVAPDGSASLFGAF